ncbi:MAG: hypothetical protein NTZ12_09510 [Candidatus Aminicenantes bacterium]|nr:hypothetical protein [Candidatus Aminicenantes bacterium]
MEIRQGGRFDPEAPIYGYFELTHEVTGEFLNREEFLIKNISVGGANFLSNYPPHIGNTYPVLIHYGGDKHPFTVKIVHSRIQRFQKQPEGVFKSGVVYSTGCQIVFDNDFQKNLILGIISNDCGIPSRSDPLPAVVSLAMAL